MKSGGSDREEIKPNRIRNISQVRESEAQVKEKRGGWRTWHEDGMPAIDVQQELDQDANFVDIVQRAHNRAMKPM